MQTTHIETAPFRLADNATPEMLIAASQELEDTLLSKLPGYVGRILVRHDARSWTDIVLWRSAEDARMMMEAAATSEACGRYFACMANENHDDLENGVVHHEVVRIYGNIRI